MSLISDIKTLFHFRNYDVTYEQRELNLMRLYCFLGAVFTPIVTVLVWEQQALYNIIFLLVVASSFFACLKFSYSSEKVKNNLHEYLFYQYLFITLYAVYEAYDKNFSGDFVLALTIVVFTFSIALKSSKQVVLYFLYTVIAGAIAMICAEEILTSVSYIISFYLVFFVAGYFIIRNNIQTQHKLKESEKFLKTLFNQSYDAFLLVDYSSRKVIDCNDAALQLLEIKKKSEIVGHERDRFQLIKMSDKELFDCRVELSQKGIWNNLTQYQTKRGKLIWVDVAITPLKVDKNLYYVTRLFDVTEKRKAEEYKEKSERSYRDLFNKSADLIYIHDKSGVFIDVNEVVVNRSGYTREELIGKTPDFMSVLDLNTGVDVDQIINQAWDGKIKKFDWWSRSKTGELIPKEIVLQRGSYFGQEVIIATGRDITERIRSQEALIKSEKDMSMVLNSIAEVVYNIRISKDGARTIEYISPQVEQVFGFTASDYIVGDIDLEQYYHPNDVAKVRNITRTMIDTKQPVTVTYRYKRETEEEYRWIEERIHPHYNIAGDHIGNYGIARDVTLQNRSSEELRISEETYREIFNNTSDMLYIQKENREFIDVNQAVLDFFSCKKEDIIGKTPDWFADPERMNVDVALGRFDRAWNGEMQYFEFWSKRGDESVPKEMILRKGKYFGQDVVIATGRNISERKEYERQLKSGRERFKGVVEYSPDGIMIQIEDKAVYANPSALNLLGVPEFEDFIGDNIFNYLLPEYHQVIKERHRKLFEEGTDQPFIHVRIKNSDGKIIDVESKPQLFKYDDRRAILIVFHDISERKQLEKEHLRAELAEETNRELQEEIQERIRVGKELDENQKYTRRIIDSSLDMICAADKEGKVTEFNKAAEQAFGYHQAELIGKDTNILYLDDQKNSEIFESLVSGTGEYSGEVTNIRKNGEEFISYLSASVLRDDQDNVIGFMGVSRDITELKKSEKELIESEENYRALYNQAYIGIAQISIDGTFNQVNQQLVQMLGYTRDELIVKSFGEITHEEDKIKIEEIKGKFFNEGVERVTFEHRYIHKTGTTIFANVTISLVKDPVNDSMYFVVVFDDITHRKNAEEELKNSLKEKEILLKEVHHRVKNNLQVISSILNLQSSYVTDANTLEILRESQDRIKSMSYIHESLYQTKDFARINFTEYIFNLSKNLLHSYQLYGGLVEMKYDLEQIYLNLDQAIPCGLIVNEILSNAFKYAFPEGRKGVISIKLEENNKDIILEVQDDGIGLPKDFNIETTETLGLQLVNTLIDQIDAELEMKSEDGTKFKINFARED